MLSANDAVSAASSSLKALFPQAVKMRLEELDSSDDDQFWLITLSFIDPQAVSPLVSALQVHPLPREYKVVKINKETGDVRSIKIRERTNG